MNNAEFFEALKLLEKEKGIPGEYLLEKIRAPSSSRSSGISAERRTSWW